MKNIHKIGLIVLLLIVSALSGCLGPSEEDLVSVASLADDISADVGKVTTSDRGLPEKKIIVFEENHASRAGQIEIAIMLNRLHKNGTKFIGLEGTLAKDGLLDVSWFHRLPDTKTKWEVAVQLLKEGEINSAEFIALCYPDVEVCGVEIAEECNVRLSDDAYISVMFYLLAIAEESLSQDQIQKANELIEQEKYGEYIDFVINAYPWTEERYKQLMDEEKIYSLEETISIYKEIKKKADRVSAEIDAESKAGLQELIEYNEARAKSSKTITTNTLALCKKSPDAPVAMTIGAAHTTEVSELLENEYAAYAVIAPISLSDTDDKSNLTSNAYDRKMQRLSVDEPGMLGAFLDNRPGLMGGHHKPPAVLEEEWFQRVSEIKVITVMIARAAAVVDDPPFGLTKDKLSLQYVTVDPDSIKRMPNDGAVIFCVDVKDERDRVVTTIGVRAKQSRETREFEETEDGLEELLEEALESVQEGKDQAEERRGEEQLIQSEVTRDVIARYSPDLKAIESTTLSG